VSIRAVAKAARVTSPSVYLHFADKTDLMFAVCEQHFERFDDLLRQAVAGIDADDVIERLRARGRAYVRYGLANPEHYRILFMHKPHEVPDRVDMAELLGRSGFGQLVEDVTRGVERGVFASDDPLLVAVQLWAGAHGLTSLLISHGDFPFPSDTDQLVESTMVMLLRGLQAVPAEV